MEDPTGPSQSALFTILQTMEHLIIASDGRPLVDMAVFGGIDRLVREIQSFLAHGSIHRDGNGEECCVNYVKNSLKSFTGQYEYEDINVFSDLLSEPGIATVSCIHGLLKRTILNAELHPVLRLLCLDQVEIEKSYEPNSFMRQKDQRQRLVDASKPFDDRDGPALAQVILFGGAKSETRVVVPLRNEGRLTARSKRDELSEDVTKLSLNNVEESWLSLSSQSQTIGEFAPSENCQQLERKSSTVAEPWVGSYSSSTDGALGARPKASSSILYPVDVDDLDIGMPIKTLNRKAHRRSSSEADVGKWHKQDRQISRLPLLLEDHSEGSSKVEGTPRLSTKHLTRFASCDPTSKNQTILNYIASDQFSKRQAPLDEANAHMVLAEAVLQSGSWDVSRTAMRSTLLSFRDVASGSKSDQNHHNESTENDGSSTTVVSVEGSNVNGEADLTLGPDVTDGSAEATALHLILAVRDLHKVKVPASDLLGMKRLVNGSESYENCIALRGDVMWAPPRPQLVLLIHTKPKVKDAMKQQQHRCGTCGMQLRPGCEKYLRYCSYFGKYCCTACHTNQSHVLPANVIHKWDFKKYKVSRFAFTVLRGIALEPLFDVDMIYPLVLERASKLKHAVGIRGQGTFMAFYLRSCRWSQEVREKVNDVLDIVDPNVLSLSELCFIKAGSYGQGLKKQIELGTRHVLNCELCKARGFNCELCRSKDVIYPFQPEAQVIQCACCFACYHRSCFLRTESCTKCQRIQRRKEAKKPLRREADLENKRM